MAKPKPYLGLVIRYDYLWSSEFIKGREEGSKDRPCAVVLGIPPEKGKEMHGVVCGITHSTPVAPDSGIEIPAKVRAYLGLDNDRQWIVTSEINEVSWDDPGIVPLPSGSWSYGDLPPILAQAFLSQVQARQSAKQLSWINRQRIDQLRAARDAGLLGR